MTRKGTDPSWKRQVRGLYEALGRVCSKTGAMVHTCNPNIQEMEAGGSETQCLETQGQTDRQTDTSVMGWEAPRLAEEILAVDGC